MTKRFLIGILISFFLVTVACSKVDNNQNTGPEVSYYTCPMHPQVKSDEPGQCPICHMDLVPVFKEKTGAMTTAEQAVSIAIESQDLAGIRTAVVKKKMAVKTFQTFGVVAFDPGLAVAQREYLDAARTSAELKQAAKRRLKLLGMGEEEIAELEKRRSASTDLYLPENAKTLWVYAALYENEDTLIKPGMKAVVKTSDDSAIYNGVVRGIDPVFNAKTRTVRARIEIRDQGTTLKPDEFVNVAFELDLGEQLTIPRSAYIDTGERKVAYVVYGDTHFVMTEIGIGEVLQDDVVVTSGLKEGESVAAAALFLVDSEAELRGGAGGHVH
jgi:Cu(I)/Ag(I) efflux system membrane fusion protein